MRQENIKLIAVVAAILSLAASASALDTKLWIGYGLPANADLAAGARSEVAKARSKRTVTMAACSATPAFADCPRQAEVTFRTHLLGIPGVQFKVYQEMMSSKAWLLDVRELAVNPDFDQKFCHLEEGRVCELGINYDDSARLLVRSADRQALKFNDPAFIDGLRYINSMMGTWKNAKSALAKLAGNEQPWDNAEVTQVYFLLNHGADPNYITGAMSGYADSSGVIRFYQRRALYKAAEHDDPKLVRFILEKGADVNAQDGPEGATALMRSASLGLTSVAKVLVELGATVSLKDKLGETALQKAQKGRHTETAAFLKQRGG